MKLKAPLRGKNKISNQELNDFENIISLDFKDKNLLKNVFIHRSYLNENPTSDLKSNERLEFLGDAVIELIVTEYMFNNYPNPEGELTAWRSALVRGKNLAEIARKFEIGKYLYLSKGEEKMGGRERELLLANAFEALIGAIYLEKGYNETKKFIEIYLLDKLPEVINKKIYLDPKTELQEKSQEELNITPTYEVLSDEGPDHAKIFTVGVNLNGKKLGVGKGSSKQSAQVQAARDALKNWPNQE